MRDEDNVIFKSIRWTSNQRWLCQECNGRIVFEWDAVCSCSVQRLNEYHKQWIQSDGQTSQSTMGTNTHNIVQENWLATNPFEIAHMHSYCIAIATTGKMLKNTHILISDSVHSNAERIISISMSMMMMMSCDNSAFCLSCLSWQNRLHFDQPITFRLKHSKYRFLCAGPFCIFLCWIYMHLLCAWMIRSLATIYIIFFDLVESMEPMTHWHRKSSQT